MALAALEVSVLLEIKLPVFDSTGQNVDMEQSSTPVLITPKLEAALLALHAASPQVIQSARLRRLDRWTFSVNQLNTAMKEKKVYNVEMQDIKGWLSSGIDDATDSLETTIHRKVRAYHEHHYLPFAEVVWANVGCLQIGYAAGRIKRLSGSKVLPKLREVAPEIDEYLGLLQEVAAIWAMIIALKPFIVKGRKPAENPKVADLTHTAICPACFGTFKLTPEGKLVHHGFRISVNGSYIGSRMGSCFGVSLAPFEKSADGTRAYHAHVTGILRTQQESLRARKAGEITKVTREGYERIPGVGIQPVIKTYNVGDPEFAPFLAQDISKIEWTIRSTEDHLTTLAAAISGWKLQPLYDELHPTKKED
jgi:hypothetical protein